MLVLTCHSWNATLDKPISTCYSQHVTLTMPILTCFSLHITLNKSHVHIIYMAILRDFEMSNFFVSNSLTYLLLRDLEELSLLKKSTKTNMHFILVDKIFIHHLSNPLTPNHTTNYTYSTLPVKQNTTRLISIMSKLIKFLLRLRFCLHYLNLALTFL